jgi:hypothetical protein
MNDIKVVLKETHPRNGWWNCKVRIGNVGRYYHIGWSTKEHRWAKNSDSDALAEKHSDFILRKAGEAASELIEAYRIPHVVLCWRENISTGLVEEIRLLPAAEFNALRDGRSRFPAWRAYRPDDADTDLPDRQLGRRGCSPLRHPGPCWLRHRRQPAHDPTGGAERTARRLGSPRV